MSILGWKEKNGIINKKIQKKSKNVCSIQKKVVTLHDFSCIVEWSVGGNLMYVGENEWIIWGGSGG